MQSVMCIPMTGCAGTSGAGGTWRVLGQLGDPGAFGEIWAACCVRECTYVLKYQRYGKIVSEAGEYSGTVTPEDVEREVNIQKRLAAEGLAPPIADWWHCYSDDSEEPTGGAIVMKALKETVESLMYRYSDIEVREQILEGCLKILEKMHSLGYYHGDLHLKNIMVDYDPSRKRVEGSELEIFNEMRYRFYFIDFGLSGRIGKDKDRILADYNTLIRRFIQIVGETPEVMARIREMVTPTLKKYGLRFNI